MDAALQLCAERGYGRLTVEGIAEHAGVSKKTIYRWWPSKAAVVIEALNEEADVRAAHPDTGDLARDMHTQLTAVIELLTPPERSPLAGLIADGLHDPDFAVELREQIQPRIDESRRRIHRAQEQAQLPADIDQDVALDLFYGPIYHRLVFHLGMPTPEYLDKLIQHTMRALAVEDT